MLYTVYYDFRGKKLKQLVEANSKFEAEDVIYNNINIHKVIPHGEEKVKPKNTMNEMPEEFKNIFGKIFE